MLKLLFGRCLILLAAASLVLGVFSCAAKPELPANVIRDEMSGAPDWVKHGCDSFWEENERSKVICGVGSVGSTRNVSLARSGATGRARTEIARSLFVKNKAMLKDYQATTTGGEEYGTSAADEQHLVDVSRQLTEMSLSGTELVETWISKNGTFYALVALKVEKFKGAVSRMNVLNEGVRKAVIDRADKAFAEMDAATDKGKE